MCLNDPAFGIPGQTSDKTKEEENAIAKKAKRKVKDKK